MWPIVAFRRASLHGISDPSTLDSKAQKNISAKNFQLIDATVTAINGVLEFLSNWFLQKI